MGVDAERVIAALAGQVECYRRLTRLTALQHEHVQADQPQLLLDVLRRRQVELDRIGELEQTVAPARKDWAKWTGGLEERDRRAAEGLVQETRKLLEGITQADRNDAMVLQQRKLTVGREMNRAAAATAVNRKYATAAYGRAKPRMDVKR